jgi:hypothetical protein
MTAIPTALCLRPSARPHPSYALLLKTKAEVSFDSPVDRTVEVLFYVFRRSNRVQFQPVFFAFTVRSAEGRKLMQLKRTPVPVFLSKTSHPGTHHPVGMHYFTICSPAVKQKARFKAVLSMFMLIFVVSGFSSCQISSTTWRRFSRLSGEARKSHSTCFSPLRSGERIGAGQLPRNVSIKCNLFL